MLFHAITYNHEKQDVYNLHVNEEALHVSRVRQARAFGQGRPGMRQSPVGPLGIVPHWMIWREGTIYLLAHGPGTGIQNQLRTTLLRYG